MLACFHLVGCATLDAAMQRGGAGGNLARGEKAALNQYMAETQRVLPSIPRDAKGLQQTRDIAKELEGKVRAVRVLMGDSSATWPEYRAFADQLRATRRQQLDALLPSWQEGLQTRNAGLGIPYLIRDGEFSDQQHPAYAVGVATVRRERENRAETADRERRERIDSGLKVWAEQSKIAAEERHQRAQALIAQGICPVCEGTKQERVFTDTDCFSCGGAGRSFNGRGCLGCGGSGKSSVTKYKTCTTCAGSGRYVPK